jgi:hypothetical protein
MCCLKFRNGLFNIYSGFCIYAANFYCNMYGDFKVTFFCWLQLFSCTIQPLKDTTEFWSQVGTTFPTRKYVQTDFQNIISIKEKNLQAWLYIVPIYAKIKYYNIPSNEGWYTITISKSWLDCWPVKDILRTSVSHGYLTIFCQTLVISRPNFELPEFLLPENRRVKTKIHKFLKLDTYIWQKNHKATYFTLWHVLLQEILVASLLHKAMYYALLLCYQNEK